MPDDSHVVPQKTVVRGACPHDCPDACALLVTVEKGRAIAVRGAPDHPPTAGVLCTKVAHYLERTYGGEGLLLGGVAGVPGAEVVIVGGGVVGTNAAQMALGMGANVTIIDKNVERLRYLDQVLHGRSHTLASNSRNLHDWIGRADFVVGGVLLPGAKAPKLVTKR